VDATLAQSQDQPRVATRSGTRWFILGFILPCVVALLLVGFSLAVLITNRELVGPVEAANVQRAAGGGLYGSSLVYRPYPYKLELYRLTKPDIAIVGSSRAMQFMAGGFNATVTNLGGAINEMADGERLIADMLALHHPKLVLITLDYWWFNPARVADPSEVSTEADIQLSLDDLIAPYRWMFEGETTLSSTLSAFGGTSGPPRIGVIATQRDGGFDVDGTYHYGAMLTGQVKHPDRKFKSTLKRLQNGRKSGKFATNADFSDQAWRSLQHIDQMLHTAGVEVRYILPPVAGAPYGRMKEFGLQLVTALHDHLAQAGIPFYDFTDAAALGTPDCEFIDGIHGGQVSYLRILRAMVPDLDAAPATRGLVKPVAELDGVIAANSGRATLRTEPGRPEIDFLDLSCNKS
jgi:hypothetical protein